MSRNSKLFTCDSLDTPAHFRVSSAVFTFYFSIGHMATGIFAIHILCGLLNLFRPCVLMTIDVLLNESSLGLTYLTCRSVIKSCWYGEVQNNSVFIVSLCLVSDQISVWHVTANSCKAGPNRTELSVLWPSSLRKQVRLD